MSSAASYICHKLSCCGGTTCTWWWSAYYQLCRCHLWSKLGRIYSSCVSGSTISPYISTSLIALFTSRVKLFKQPLWFGPRSEVMVLVSESTIGFWYWSTISEISAVLPQSYPQFQDRISQHYRPYVSVLADISNLDLNSLRNSLSKYQISKLFGIRWYLVTFPHVSLYLSCSFNNCYNLCYFLWINS